MVQDLLRNRGTIFMFLLHETISHPAHDKHLATTIFLTHVRHSSSVLKVFVHYIKLTLYTAYRLVFQKVQKK